MLNITYPDSFLTALVAMSTLFIASSVIAGFRNSLALLSISTVVLPIFPT